MGIFSYCIRLWKKIWKSDVSEKEFRMYMAKNMPILKIYLDNNNAFIVGDKKNDLLFLKNDLQIIIDFYELITIRYEYLKNLKNISIFNDDDNMDCKIQVLDVLVIVILDVITKIVYMIEMIENMVDITSISCIESMNDSIYIESDFDTSSTISSLT